MEKRRKQKVSIRKTFENDLVILRKGVLHSFGIGVTISPLVYSKGWAALLPSSLQWLG